MAEESKKPTGSKFLPQDLKTSDIPAADRMFLYIATQEAKGNIMSKADWETMAQLSDNSVGWGTLKSSFGAIRAAAKEHAEKKGVTVGDGTAKKKPGMFALFQT